MLVTLDTVRADRLPAYGYAGIATPALDALAKGHFFACGRPDEGKNGEVNGQKRLIESESIHTATLAAPPRRSHT